MRVWFRNIGSLRYRRMSARPRSNLRRSERDLGRLRRRIDMQLQPMRRLQSGLSHVLPESLPTPSEPRVAEPSSRDPRQISPRQSCQVNGNPAPHKPLRINERDDGWMGRRMREANVKRERKREMETKRKMRIYINDFPNYLLHFT